MQSYPSDLTAAEWCLLEPVVVTAANIQDRQAAGWLLTDAHLSGVELEQMKGWADQGYTGEGVEEEEIDGLDLEIVRRQGSGFRVWGWVVDVLG